MLKRKTEMLNGLNGERPKSRTSKVEYGGIWEGWNMLYASEISDILPKIRKKKT